MKPTVVFKKSLAGSIDHTATAYTGIASGYYLKVANLIEKYSDDPEDAFREWGFNDLLNDELYRLSTLVSERNRIQDEIEAI